MPANPFFLDAGSLLDIGTAGVARLLGLNKPKDLQFTDPAILEAAINTLHQKHPNWNEDDIKKYVQFLATYVPHALQSPALTDSLVGQFIAYGGIDPSTFKTLVSTEKSMADTELKSNPNAKSGLAALLWGNPGRTYFMAPVFRG